MYVAPPPQPPASGVVPVPCTAPPAPGVFGGNAPPPPPIAACPPPPLPSSQNVAVTAPPVDAEGHSLPPAPGVLPVALASTVPWMAAAPYTAKMTGLGPTSLRVLVLAIVRLWKTRTSAVCPPPVWCTLAWMTGAVPEHPPVLKACAPESYVPLQSVVAPDGGVRAVGSKLLGA